MAGRTKIYGTEIRSGSIPTFALSGGVVSSSAQLPTGTISSSAQTVAAIAGQTVTPAIINATGAISGASIQTSGNGILLGNVGIGTTSPSARLYVEGGSANWNETTPGQTVGTIHLDPGVTTDNFGNAITFGASDDGGSGTLAHAGIYVRTDGGYGSKMYFATTNDYGAGSKTRMMVDFNGNVGIGTTSPSAPLHIYGNTGATGEIRLESSNGKLFSIGSTGTAYGSANNLIFYDITAGRERARFDTSGNFGLNIVPSASLHVSGTMMIQGVVERVNITGSAPPTTLNVDAISGSVFYLSGSSANNWTVNFRGSAATSLNTMMYDGQSMTFAVLVNHSSVGYTASAHQVDGTSITPRWQGGTVPSGSGTSTDIYSYTVIKRSNAVFNIFASQTKFA
jgi:hypothetical protein